MKFYKENGELPVLPPNFTWDPECGEEHLAPPKWRALGPSRGSREPLMAYARFKEDDNPQGCASKAWALWERLSGISKEVYLESRRQISPFVEFAPKLEEVEREPGSDDIYARLLYAANEYCCVGPSPRVYKAIEEALKIMGKHREEMRQSEDQEDGQDEDLQT